MGEEGLRKLHSYLEIIANQIPQAEFAVILGTGQAALWGKSEE